MTADIKLLPLPDNDGFVSVDGEGNETFLEFFTAERTQDYARANVEHYTAAKDAEVEALREEKERWRILCNGESARRMDAEDRAERLEEALRDALECGEDGDWQSARNYINEALRDHDQEVGNG